MLETRPILFEYYPDLEDKVPWTPLLTNIPAPIEKLEKLEEYFNYTEGSIYIKRDDINHNIYGGNKLRKFEFIFGNILKKDKKGVITMGGIGTNHGLACAIICKSFKPSLKCDLFLYPQPLTWHVQRSLMLFNYFGAQLHLGKGDIGTFLRALGFQLRHSKYYLMFPGGSPLFGFGTPLGTIGFINAIGELHNQIEEGGLKQPDVIFVATGSTGTAAGLLAGIKLFNLDIKLNAVPVYDEFIANPKAIVRNANRALKYLRKKDISISKLKVHESDLIFTEGYRGSGYGIKTKKSQNAVDLINKLEGRRKGFKLETTYTGKAAAAMIDYISNKENKRKNILFWNTYNSNDLDHFLKENGYSYKNLPKKFHQFFKKKSFQCWQIESCPQNKRENCLAFMNHDYRCWNILNCSEDLKENCKKFNILKDVISLED